MKAYCYASGQIEFGKKLPDGALPLAVSRSEKKLKDVVTVLARHACDGKTLLVPGIPEAKNSGDAYLNFRYFSDCIDMRLTGKKGWPPVTKELEAARERSMSI